MEDFSHELDAVCTFYGKDLNKFNLTTQFESFSINEETYYPR